MFCVYDIQAQTYGLPWYAPTSGVALRMFTEAANTPDSDYAKHPEDYLLVCLGEYDQTNASFQILEKHTELGRAIDYRNTDT